MSTKTTFKRIALAVVAALGFGVLTSVAPATAATASFTTIPSLTVVGSNNGYGYFPVTLTSGLTGGGNRVLEDTESITAVVTSFPTGVDSTTAATDLRFTSVERTDVNVWEDASQSGYTSSADATSLTIHGGPAADQASVTNPARPTRLGTYWIAVRTASNKALDKGVYTVRIRLTDSNGSLLRQMLLLTLLPQQQTLAQQLHLHQLVVSALESQSPWTQTVHGRQLFRMEQQGDESSSRKILLQLVQPLLVCVLKLLQAQHPQLLTLLPSST